MSSNSFVPSAFFPEWDLQENLLHRLKDRCEITVLGTTKYKNYQYPIYAFTFGNSSPEAPVLGLVGGVHGLERIGSQVVLSLMQTVSELLEWDETIHQFLKQIRIFFVPMVNPIGIRRQTRANPRGVDLMRNAPVDSTEPTTFLVGGHRISPKLWWYRGEPGAMEVESQALVDFVCNQLKSSLRAITVDFHSGFGIRDRIWFPYAKSTHPFPAASEVYGLKKLLDRTFPYNIYQIEPQSKNYTTHGDLWDYSYDRIMSQRDSGFVYLPLALEMGSWMWVKKNPLQLFKSLGPFHPMLPHRQKRILRRHQTLFDFLIRAVVSGKHWAQGNSPEKLELAQQALQDWYPNHGKF